MAKEIHIADEDKALFELPLAALPDPGVGKRLIVFVRGSTVRLHMVDDAPIIGVQETAEEGSG